MQYKRLYFTNPLYLLYLGDYLKAEYDKAVYDVEHRFFDKSDDKLIAWHRQMDDKMVEKYLDICRQKPIK